MDESRYQAWLDERGKDNLCIRLPRDMVGLDIDAYKGDLSDEAKEWLKALPPTYRSSSRFDPLVDGRTGPDYDGLSGIRLYRLPKDMVHLAEEPVWVSQLPFGCGELVRFAHRQAKSWPSIHGVRGVVYDWYDEKIGLVRPEGLVPAPEDVADLPRVVAEQLLKPPREARGEKASGKAERPAAGRTSAAWDYPDG